MCAAALAYAATCVTYVICLNLTCSYAASGLVCSFVPGLGDPLCAGNVELPLFQDWSSKSTLPTLLQIVNNLTDFCESKGLKIHLRDISGEMLRDAQL